jgi:hypothetical protein
VKLTNKDLRRIIKEELTNVLQEKGSTSNAADETIEALELMGALAPSFRSVVLFSHPEGHANLSAKPSSIESAIQTILKHKDGFDSEDLEIIGFPRFSIAYFKAAQHLLDHRDDIMQSLPEADRWEFFQNSPENVVMKFSVPNPFDRGRSASRVPSIEFRIFTGKDRIHHEKVVKFEGDALMNDSTLYSLIEAFQDKDQVTLYDWANQQLQGL